MSHENSETVQIGGRWYNVRGGSREPLKPVYPFEKESYNTVTEAVAAARRRSALGGGPDGGESVPVDYFGRQQGSMRGRPVPNALWRAVLGRPETPFTIRDEMVIPSVSSSGEDVPGRLAVASPSRGRVVRRLRPDLVTGTRGGSLTLADILRSATGLGSQLFGGQLGTAGGGLADVLRSRQVPEPAASPTAPPVDVAPQPEQGFVDPLANLGLIPSLQNEPQVIARQLAAEVEAGKMTMAEAVSRYRALRFGGR